MKKQVLLLLLSIVLPVSYAHADNSQLHTYLQQLPIILYAVSIEPSNTELDLQPAPIKLMEIQSSVDRMKNNMRYFRKKDTLKKNGMRPIIKRHSIAIRYSYHW